MSPLRSVILAVTNRAVVRRVFTGGAGRRLAIRFVAGEDLDDALKVCKAVDERGALVSLDYLGENVATSEAAQAATNVYRTAIERVDAAGLKTDLSVKLTQLGLDLDPEVALGNAAIVAARAAEADSTMTLDMEDHRFTDRTIDTCLRLAHRYPERIGVAVQSYLFRTPADLERLIQAKVRVRLCKGAYRESRRIAYSRAADVDAAYARMMIRLLESDAYPMIATHDARLIRHAIRNAELLKRARETFEFQMLYGVRRDLQTQLVNDGYRLRVYVPFGTEWYPYLVRRIAERPANLRFFLRQLISR